MVLRPVDARVLACLIEKETTVPDSYPLTANALRSACNQSTNRNPVTSYDDRTIDEALVSLKAAGLVRFVHPSHGGRTLRYRHVADERWELGSGELGVVALLVLRGPETTATLRARAERFLDAGGTTVEAALTTLMELEPDPFVRRLDPGPGEREPRYQQLLVDTLSEPGAVPDASADAVDATSDAGVESTGPAAIDGEVVSTSIEPSPAPDRDELVEALRTELTDLRRRVERLERLFDG